MVGTKIKICGLYRDEDIACVNRERPDYAGFVFYPPSHRHVEQTAMARFRRQLSPEIPAVGVFVNAPVEQVARLLGQGLIQIAQLHGGEDEAYADALRGLVPEGKIWKAFAIRTPEDVARAMAFPADRILLDNGYGTGKCFDWRLLTAANRPFILAGGLTPENAAQAIKAYRPWGVDISSGVETRKQKDPEKIHALMQTVRSIDHDG